MDTLKNYVENMFHDHLPTTEESLEIKANILTSMEDKYADLLANNKTEEEALQIVINQFGDINELKEELNLSSNDSFSLNRELRNLSSYFQKPLRAWILSFCTATILLYTLIWGWNANVFGFFVFFAILFLYLIIHILSGTPLSKPSDNTSSENWALITSIGIIVFLILAFLAYMHIIDSFALTRANGEIHINDNLVTIVEVLFISFAIIIPFLVILIASGRFLRRSARTIE